MEEMQVRQGPPSPRNELSKEEIAELQAEVGDVVIIEDKSPRKRTDDLEGALPAGLPSTPLDGKCSSVGMYFAVIFVFLSWIFILAAASSEDWIVGDDDYKTGLRYTCHTTDNGQVCWELPDTDGTGMWSCNPRDVGNSVKGLMGFAAVFVTFSLILSVAVFQTTADSAKIKKKMLYSSSFDALKKCLVGVQKYIQATDESEASAESIEEQLRKTDRV